jgi:hypothetical protein
MFARYPPSGLVLLIGEWLGGDVILPELIRANRPEYVAAFKAADPSLPDLNLDLVHGLLSRLLDQQAPPEADAPPIDQAFSDGVEVPFSRRAAVISVSNLCALRTSSLGGGRDGV